MGGQEEWEGRRAALVQTPRKPKIQTKNVLNDFKAYNNNVNYLFMSFLKGMALFVFF